MTYLILLIAFIVMAVMWWRARAAAEVAIELCARETIRASIAAERSAKYRESLAQALVGMQALAEKSIEAEWIRSGEGLVPRGVWVGDDFIEVEASEVGDVEVGQPVGDSDNLAPELYFPRAGRTYDWKREMP